MVGKALPSKVAFAAGCATTVSGLIFYADSHAKAQRRQEKNVASLTSTSNPIDPSIIVYRFMLGFLVIESKQHPQATFAALRLCVRKCFNNIIQ